MPGKTRLTDLLTQNPPDARRLAAYSRSRKSFENVDLVKLATTYQDMKKKLNKNFTILHVASFSCTKPEVIKTLVNEGWSVNDEEENVGSPLGIALDRGNLGIAKLLIELGADVNSNYLDGKTPMFFALSIREKDERTCIAAAKLLLESGVSINAIVYSVYGERAIHVAAANGSTSIVSFFLQNGAELNTQDKKGVTPLLRAVSNNQLEMVKLLLLNGPDLYLEDEDRNTPLLVAVIKDNTEMVRVLVQGGCDVNRVCWWAVETSPLHTAVIYPCNMEMIKLLVSLGANAAKALSNGVTPLHTIAASENAIFHQFDPELINRHKSAVEFLANNGGNLNSLDNNMENPLQVALRSGSLNIAELFIKMGADFKLTNEANGDTLFHLVVPFNSNIITVLLEFGADYTVNNNDGLTPYHIGITSKIDLQYIKCFWKHGCPFDQPVQTVVGSCSVVWNKLVRKNKKVKKIFLAQRKFFKGIKENNIELVKRACKEGAVVTSCCEDLKYPLHFVAHKGFKDLLVFLLNENVQPNIVNERGETPLFLAASKGHYDICRVLLSYGACYNYSNTKCPKTPREIACEFNHNLIVELMDCIFDMFSKARSKKNLVIEFLEKKLDNEIDYKMYSSVTDNKGNTVLAKVLQTKNSINAVNLLKMRLNHSLGTNL